MHFTSFIKFTTFAFLSVTLLSCSTMKNRKAQASFKSEDFVASVSEEVSLDQSALKKNPNSLLAKTTGRLDLVYNQKDYRFWIEYFTKRAPKTFTDHMGNAYEVKKVVQKILADNGVPIEVFYLGLIESGYNTKIKSRAQATGPWQFMKGTAVRYGLRVDNEVDERYNIYKSTEAAARYLVDLYNIFGNWELALCGYNAGEYRIISAIRKGNSRDYRELVSQGLLPRETVLYIPKIVAARDIFLHPERFGMNYEKRNGRVFEQVASFESRRSLSLKNISQKFNIPRSSLIVLNPELKNGTVKVRPGESFKIHFPQEYKNLAWNSVDFSSESKAKSRLAYTKMKNDGRKPASVVVKSKQRYKIYVANKKEKIKDVARRHGVNPSVLARYNGLNGSINHQLKIGQRLRIPI